MPFQFVDENQFIFQQIRTRAATAAQQQQPAVREEEAAPGQDDDDQREARAAEDGAGDHADGEGEGTGVSEQ